MFGASPCFVTSTEGAQFLGVQLHYTLLPAAKDGARSFTVPAASRARNGLA